MFNVDKFNFTLFVCGISTLDAELIVNSKDFPTTVKGAIVEVIHGDSEQNKLLLQIMGFKDDAQSRGKYYYMFYTFIN